MLGAIIGDIVGSRFEYNNAKEKSFELFDSECSITDDTVLTVAVAKAILECKDDFSCLSEMTVKYLREIGETYPIWMFGGMFREWLESDDPQPYNSYGNGAAMRVSPCGFAAKSLSQAIELSKAVTEVTHNHPEGIKGAEATTVAIYLAISGNTKQDIQKYISEHYYKLNFDLDDIRNTYSFSDTCQGSVPYAIKAFLESTSFEDAIRNAISLGGDSDTIAAITGSIAEAYYGIPNELCAEALQYLPDPLYQIVKEFILTCDSMKNYRSLVV